MIHYIRGTVIEALPGKIVLENNGMGFEINVADGSFALLEGTGEPVTVYTFMAVSEDDISLYGFSDRESLAMFRLLTTVSGIGNKGALAILSKLSVRELKQAIIFEDADSIAKAKGIGKKTAAKLVLELKDKIDSADIAGGIDMSTVKTVNSSAKNEAVSALVSLGFSKSEAMSLLVGINDDSLSAEEYVKLALRARR